MSNLVFTRVWQTPFPTHASKLVALKMADVCGDDGENVFPSVEHISRQTGVSVTTIREIISDFEVVGLLVVVREGHGNHPRYSTTIRRLDLDVLAALANRAKVWVQIDRQVTDLKTGAQKIDPKTGAVKTRPAWRVEPAAGTETQPLRSSEGHPSGGRTPTPPVAGPLYRRTQNRTQNRTQEDSQGAGPAVFDELCFEKGTLSIEGAEAERLLAEFPHLDLKAVAIRAAADLIRFRAPSLDDKRAMVRRAALFEVQRRSGRSAPSTGGKSLNELIDEVCQ